MQSEYIGGIGCKMEISMYDTYVSIDLETTGLNPKRDRCDPCGAGTDCGRIFYVCGSGAEIGRTDHRTYGNPG